MRDTLFDPLELIDMKIDRTLVHAKERVVDNTSLANLMIKGIPLDDEEFIVTGFTDQLPMVFWREGTVFNRQVIREVLHKLYDKYLHIYADINFEVFEYRHLELKVYNSKTNGDSK